MCYQIPLRVNVFQCKNMQHATFCTISQFWEIFDPQYLWSTWFRWVNFSFFQKNAKHKNWWAFWRNYDERLFIFMLLKVKHFGESTPLDKYKMIKYLQNILTDKNVSGKTYILVIWVKGGEYDLVILLNSVIC